MVSTTQKIHIANLSPSHIDLGLDRMTQLMERLGNPHLQFKSIHIAGTNGKGSTAAFIASVLSEAGYRAGLYTSPHLERFSERIKVDGEEISQRDIDKISGEVEAASKDLPAGDPTYFEFATALAFLYFARQQVDIAVIETGLGGRLDATNIITPLLSIITPVALDHSEYLGDSLQGVAAEKGGIIKEGVPVIIGRQVGEVLCILEDIAKERDARALVYGRDFNMSKKGEGSFNYSGSSLKLEDVELSMYGDYQMENAATALAALELIKGQGFDLDEKAVREGLMNTSWPGRFEIISQNPDIILDGAHNPAAARRLKDAVTVRYGGEKGVVVAGFMSDKDIAGILEELAPLASTIILTRPGEERAFDPEGKNLFSEILEGSNVRVIPSVCDAVEKGIELAKGCIFMLITGSLYTVGEARGILKR